MSRTADALARGIRAERGRHGWTQAELGERLGWSRSTVAAIESGDRGVSAGDLPAICRALGVPLGRLLVDAPPEDRAALGLTSA